jgi:ubiquinone biosynthesis protein UbiJ
MFNKLWTLFLQALWPLLWPIIRDNMVEVVQDLASWIRKALADQFNTASQQQQKTAENKARSAQDQAASASTDEERIKAQATADAWREIAEKLSQDNEKLKQQLEETIRKSQIYARKRIDSEAEQRKVQDKVQSLKPPEDK